MKKDISKYILVFILGGLFFGAFSVYATVTILSGQVDYTPRDNTWDVNNVEGALDDLYDMAKTNGGNTDGFIGTNWQYGYTGSYQVFDTPATGEYKIELWGAQGGNAKYSVTYSGGLGSYTSGVVSLDKGDQLYIYVGGQGITANAVNNYTNNGLAYNGGGPASSYPNNSTGGSGGGATDVRILSLNPTADELTASSFDGLKARIMVAAGGGGARSHGSYPNYSGDGGAAGGLTGYNGIPKSSTCYNYGGGATQIKGGTPIKCASEGRVWDTSSIFGIGWHSVVTNLTIASATNSGGGGGYYGGGLANHGPAGGGSSFISGHDGCDAIAESSTSSSIVHTGQPNHYTGIIFTNTTMIDGAGYNWTNTKGSQTGQPQPDGTSKNGHSGNGYARITYMG